MKIYPILNFKQNFRANLRNQTYIDYWGDKREYPQYEVIDSYDRQIKAIQKAKKMQKN